MNWARVKKTGDKLDRRVFGVKTNKFRVCDESNESEKVGEQADERIKGHFGLRLMDSEDVVNWARVKSRGRMGKKDKGVFCLNFLTKENVILAAQSFGRYL